MSKITLDTLAVEIQHLRDELAERDTRIESLERWKRTCGAVASTWGGVCIAVTAIGGAISTFWEVIKKFFQGLPT